jgi:hypothetical protein
MENDIVQQNLNTSNNVSQLDNENISTNNVNNFIENDIYERIYIILNMQNGLCNNVNYCYFRFDLYNTDNTIFNTIYIKYENNKGLMNKKLYIFESITENEKNLLINGYIKITAYQLLDCLDDNPYIFGIFKLNETYNFLKGLSLYKVINITSVYNFYFDNVIIYPYFVSGQVIENKQANIIFNDVGTVMNSNNNIEKTYTYSLTYSKITNNILYEKAITINIDGEDIWYRYNNFYCNIMFYLKNGTKYIIPQLVFNKFNDSLHLNEKIEIDKNKLNLNDIIKFSITYICGEESGIKTNINNIKISKQGNIYKEN